MKTVFVLCVSCSWNACFITSCFPQLRVCHGISLFLVDIRLFPKYSPLLVSKLLYFVQKDFLFQKYKDYCFQFCTLGRDCWKFYTAFVTWANKLHRLFYSGCILSYYIVACRPSALEPYSGFHSVTCDFEKYRLSILINGSSLL